MTQELNVFSTSTLEQAELPADVQIAKRFLLSDVEALKQEFLQVKDMGEGTVAEWLKGLPGRGNDMHHDASKWEKWEHLGGLARIRSQLYPGYMKPPASVSVEQQKTSSDGNGSPSPSSTLPVRQSLSQGRHERTAEQVAELKATRKAEIERRALFLDPPLTADVLHHIPSFQAATHIVAQLDDHAWDLLKPRLLAQRVDAETALEAERTAQVKLKLEQGHEEEAQTEPTLATSKEARDRIDKDWEEVQAPLRAKIAGYADEVIRDSWGKGKKVKRDNCSRFAVDALLHVRSRFYAEVVKEAAAARAAGKTPPTDPPEGPFTQKLTLENMKWIFDTKIKPHTETFRKELFYCNGCEGNFKPFGFEGVIQHYAAKHTTVLSLGNIVVHWRAEWPEHPPFSAEARPAKPPHYQQGPGSFPFSGGPPPVSFAYQPRAAVPALPAPYSPSVGYGYNAPTYNDYYQPLPPGPVPTPQPYQPQPPPFPSQMGYGPPPPYAGPPAPYPPYQPTAVPYLPPTVPPTAEPMRGYGGQYDYPPGPYPAPANVSIPPVPPQPPAYPGLHQTKLEDIARNSREVWRLLGDIKDLPGSIRVFVTIHHLVKRFRSRFYETPVLSMFIDGLSNNKDMRPVRNVNGLVCKACHLGLGNAASVERDRKDFSLPQLANHFQTKHIDPMQRTQAPNTAPALDWVVDMVLLPDNATISRFASLGNEMQRSLVAAAFPAASESQPTSATEPFPREDLNRHTSRVDRGHTGGVASVNKTSASTKFGGTGFLMDNRNSAQSSNTATPTTMSDNGRSTHSEGGRDSSQGFRLNRVHSDAQNRNHTVGKNKRGKPHGESGPGNRGGKRSKKDAGKFQREGQDSRGGYATHRVDTPPVPSPSAYAEPARTAGGPQAWAPPQPSPRPPQQVDEGHLRHSRSAAHSDRRADVNILGALESYLEQRHSPRLQPQQREATLRTDSRDAGTAPGHHQYVPASYTQPRHSDSGNRDGSLARFSQYETARPASRERAPSGERFEATSESRAGPVWRRRDEYGAPPPQAGFIEPLPHHEEEGRFGRQVWRPDDRDHEAARFEPEYRRYQDDERVLSRRPPVEAYEIVHVIDETGEYYIRRPVRREPKPVYMYEERRVYRDSASYAPHEPAYAPVARPSMVRETVRASMAPDSRPVPDRRVDPAYYEEYDPRFPAA